MSRKQQEFYAFWEYDQFPFVLSGKAVDRTDKQGRIEIEGYGGMRFKPLRVIAGSRGRELSEQLSQLRNDYRAEQQAVGQRFRKEALRLAPFLKDCQRSSFYHKPRTKQQAKPVREGDR